MCECKEPHLGLATTRELLDELSARVEMHALGGLDYRTVDGETFSQEATHLPATGARPIRRRGQGGARKGGGRNRQVHSTSIG